MYAERFFDQLVKLIDCGEIPPAMCMLVGKLYQAHRDPLLWPDVRAALRSHPLHAALMEDPFSARSVARPRGYAGDAALIDIIYDRRSDVPTTDRGQAMLQYSMRFPASEAVRRRRDYAETLVSSAWQSGKRILVLACGHFREGDGLAGHDLSRITLVDQDPISLDRVRDTHGDAIIMHEANVFRYLRAAASERNQFDLVYTLGLTDYLDLRALQLLHRLVKSVLAPGGTFTLANFLPNHLGTGWMDAVMDWQLIYRDEAELLACAGDSGLAARTWRDGTGAIVWCEMTHGS